MQRASLLSLCAVLLALPAQSEAQSQEERRRQLQEQLGVKKPPTPPAQAAVPDAGVPVQVEAPATAPELPATATARPTAPRPRTLTFAEDARPILVKECESCHRADGKAKKSKWVLSGGPEDYEATLRFVKTATPAQSPLLRKGTGATLHGGKKSLAEDSAGYATLLKWIEGGAAQGKLGAAPTPVAEAAPATPSPGTALPTGPQPSPGTSAPVVSAPEEPLPGAQPPPPDGSTAQGAAPAPASEVADSQQRFDPRVHAQLQEGCGSCHSADGLAASTHYLTSSDPQVHLQSVLPLVTPGSASTSVFFQRAQGQEHQAGAVWEPGSAELTLLAQWIDAGALGPAAPAVVASAATPGAAAPPTAAPSGHPGGIPLGTFPVLGSLSLNGRFDLNYERVGYNDHPFQSEGANALRSYHQFLFLTRQSTSDPVTLTLEVLSLQFWEVGYRISQETWPVKVTAKLGKVLVPFGADPLFHHSYGGHAGFDQKVLPLVFAREGVTVNVQRRVGPFSLTGDAYVIAGYRLRRADSLLSLQSDFAPLEETRLGFGARLGGSWGPINLWYSPYFNTLGFGRRLFMQALDLTVWRPRGVPVAQHFSLGVGLLRGDVSGGADEGYGGPGADYYHFASYLQLRYHPTDWLYVQYRQGLRTFGNRRGLFLDSTDLTRDDGSTHNLGVMARWRGLSAGLFHFWNMEKADEVPDDFTRLVVAYEF
ncbi:MAG: hypothetical protein M3Y59_23665 [Myxococcota bacterium]|nr:hypothetical protein [Myxococcota bacterium]